MEMRKWIEGQRPRRVADIAVDLTVTRVTLQRWMAGRLMPSPEHIEIIESVSGGLVRANDMAASYRAARVAR